MVAGVVGLLEKEASAFGAGGARVLAGHFMTVPQAIGFPLDRTDKVVGD